MKSKKIVKSLLMSNEGHERVLFEWFLGKLKELGIIEDAMLEIRGANGVLRMDLSEEEFQKMFAGR